MATMAYWADTLQDLRSDALDTATTRPLSGIGAREARRRARAQTAMAR